MKSKTFIASGLLVVFLAVTLYFYRQDRVLVSTISDSRNMKAEIIQTNSGLFSKKYCLCVTTIKTGVKVIINDPRMLGMSRGEVCTTKLHWRTDTSLKISLPNGIVKLVFFDDLGPPPK